MTRRTGGTAGRDAGSTTGVATAVLALLSAGTLATLGVVTAGDLRDVGRAPVQDSRVDSVGPPAAIALTPTPATTPAPGGGSGGAGGGRAAGGVQSLPEAVVGGSTAAERPGLSGTGTPPPGPPASTPAPGTPTPTPTPTPRTGRRPGLHRGDADPEPVGQRAGGEGRPAPGPGQARRPGRQAGQAGQGHHRGAGGRRGDRRRAGPRAHPRSTPRGRAVGHGHGPGQPAVTPVGPPASSPSPTAAQRSQPGRGPDRTHGRGHGPAEVPVPYSPVPATPAASVAPEPTTAVPGHDESNGSGQRSRQGGRPHRALTAAHLVRRRTRAAAPTGAPESWRVAARGYVVPVVSPCERTAHRSPESSPVSPVRRRDHQPRPAPTTHPAHRPRRPRAGTAG